MSLKIHYCNTDCNAFLTPSTQSRRRLPGSQQSANNTAWTPDASCKVRGAPATRTSDRVATKVGVPTTSLGFDNSLEQLTEFRKVLCLHYSFLTQRTNLDRSNEETYRMLRAELYAPKIHAGARTPQYL